MTVDRYAVVGNPIAHSKSPTIHAAFATQTGQAMTYDKRLVELGEFEVQAKEFFELGGKGLNVTVPFKENAFRFADVLTERAQLAGAVNTLAVQSDGKILGDNTDGAGLVGDLKALGWVCRGKRVLVLGAGGAVRGAAPALLAEQPVALVIANRTESKAQTLADLFQHLGSIRACEYADLAGQAFDVIINGTSASLNGDLPPLPSDVITPTSGVYDMMYGPTLTPFLRWAQHQGANSIADGLGMLVEQAAEAFYLWRGIRPEVSSVKETLRHTLNASL